MVTATVPIPLQLLIRIKKISDGNCVISCKTVPKELLRRRLYDRMVDKYTVIRNNCRGINNLSYTIHLR